MAIDYNPCTERLFAAADALLNAMASKQGGNATVAMTLDSLAVKRLSSIKAFTPDELVCAMDMLMRMGFVVPPAQV